MIKAVPNLKNSDLELVSLFKESGDNSYIGELFKRYAHLIFGVCMKYLKDEEDSKDAVMQIFEKLPEDLKKHEITNFKGWLHSVAKNHCLMELRSKTAKQEKDIQLKVEYETFMEYDEELHLNKEQELVNLEEAIKELKEEQKICIELFYLHEKSYQEVVAITGYEMNKVKSCIQNGKRNLKILMTDKNERQNR
jgi:RNA polymerase sigma-70 factor (ECF subfamily)